MIAYRISISSTAPIAIVILLMSVSIGRAQDKRLAKATRSGLAK